MNKSDETIWSIFLNNSDLKRQVFEAKCFLRNLRKNFKGEKCTQNGA